MAGSKPTTIDHPDANKHFGAPATGGSFPTLDFSKLKTSGIKSHRCGVSLQIVLDISSSVSGENENLQRRATAAALRSPRVMEKIKQAKGIEVRTVVFAKNSKEVIPWGIIEDEEDANRYASLIEQAKAYVMDGTEIGDAVTTAIPAFDKGYCKASKPVIDLSSDMQDGIASLEAGRIVAHPLGIMLNAIVAANTAEQVASGKLSAEKHFISLEPVGFAKAATWEEYEEAIIEKFEKELAAAISAKEKQDRADLNNGQWVAPTPIPASLQNGTRESTNVVPIRF